MSQKKLAKILSILLGPLWLPILLIVGLYKTGLTGNQINILLPSLFVLLVILPISFLILGPYWGWIKNWEMKRKEERLPFFVLVLISAVVSLTLIFFVGNRFLFELTLVLVILLITISIISKYWKISIHTSLNTAAAILLNFLFDGKLPYIFISVPLIYWARIYLKRHTHKQLLMGILLSSLITLIGIFVVLKF